MGFSRILLTFLIIACFTGCAGFFQTEADVWRREAREEGIEVSPEGKWLTGSASYWQRKVGEFQGDNPSRKPGGIVLLGDSITERSPFESLKDLNVINRGIGGDKIGGWKYYGLLDRMDVSVYQLEPSKLFIMIGVNDIVYAHTPEGNMKSNLKRLFRELGENLPGSEVYVYSILPSRGTFSKYNGEISDFNRFIEGACRKFEFVYLDLHRYFTDEKGELRGDYAADALHLNKRGYTEWKKFAMPYLYK